MAGHIASALGAASAGSLVPRPRGPPGEMVGSGPWDETNRPVRSIRRRERPRTQERWLVDIRSLSLDFDKVDTTLGQTLPLKLYLRTDIYR